jgi:hypothetical protein
MMCGLLGQFVLDSNHFPFLRVLFGRHLSLVGDSLYPFCARLDAAFAHDRVASSLGELVFGDTPFCLRLVCLGISEIWMCLFAWKMRSVAASLKLSIRKMFKIPHSPCFYTSLQSVDSSLVGLRAVIAIGKPVARQYFPQPTCLSNESYERAPKRETS